MQYKQFPPNPSLEHLKSQAKQLLKAHKEGALDACQRIRAFFPKLSDATDIEIQDAAFGLQDAQLVIAREYGFASWTRLKEAVRHQERDAEKISPKDLLFQILRTPDLTQGSIQRVEELITDAPSLIFASWTRLKEAVRHQERDAEKISPKDLLFQILRTPDLTQGDIQRVEELITDTPSLISATDENGQTPIEALASRDLINFGKERWYRPIRQLYDLFMEHGAVTNIVAAIRMDDLEQVQAEINSKPDVLRQRFDIPGNWRGVNLLAIAAGCARIEIAKVLIAADRSLVTEGQAEGKAPMDLLVKPWHHSAFEAEPRKPLYDLLVENGAIPDLAAALMMDDWTRAGAYVTSNPQLLEQQFVCGNQIKFRPSEIAAAYGRDFIFGLLCAVATANTIDITQDLASALTQTFDLDVTEQLLETSKPSPSVMTNALVFACEVYQPEKVRLLLKYGADPSASVRAKFRYDVIQNLKLRDNASHDYEMSPLLVAIGTWYGVREEAPALDECLGVVEALLEAEPDLQRNYKVDIDGEILELTPLAYTQKLASLFPDKPFDRIIEVLLAADAV